MSNPREIVQSLTARLQNIDYNGLPISDYNKKYINRLIPALPYYMEIYMQSLDLLLRSQEKSTGDITLVDYGGGSGFVSILAKSIGIGKVIYVDINPDSVETITQLKATIGVGPDVILQGDADRLNEWCKQMNEIPQMLIATDLIEHIYNLDSFFGELVKVNPQMDMLFTTASTPFNPIIKRRLYKYMYACEKGNYITPNYYAKRLNYIRENFPALGDEEAALWCEKTRGMTYTDIQAAIENNQLPEPADAYNTCDPETGNWTERILPIATYRELLKPHHYHLTLQKGFFNTHRSNVPASMVAKCVNELIKYTGKCGLVLAPFIILQLKPEK